MEYWSDYNVKSVVFADTNKMLWKTSGGKPVCASHSHTLFVYQVASPAQVFTHPELSKKLTHKWVLGEGGGTEGAFKVSLKRTRRGGFCYQWCIELTTLQPARPPTKTNMCLWERDMGDTSVLKSTFLKVTETEAAISHLQYFIRTHTHTHNSEIR